jgi:hypothetical protein
MGGMMDIVVVKQWSGEIDDVVGRLTLTDDYKAAFESERMQALVDFAYERQDDGTLRIVAARIRPSPSVPLSP